MLGAFVVCDGRGLGGGVLCWPDAIQDPTLVHHPDDRHQHYAATVQRGSLARG